MISKSLMTLMLLFPGIALSAELSDMDSRITEVLANIQREQGYPGVSLAISYRGDYFSGQAGYSDTSQGKPVSEDTIFRVYSLTKGITGILAKILEVNGRFSPSAQIDTYLANLPPHLQKISGQQLLTHRSGIRHYHDNEEWLRLSRDHCLSPADAFSSFISNPLIAESDTEESYSSFGYVLLSGVLEASAGKPFRDLMHEYIFAPAEAELVYFDDPTNQAELNASVFYEPVDGEYVEAPSIDNSCKFGGGALNSTPMAIAKIYGAFFSGTLTKESPQQVVASLPSRISLSGEGLGGRSALVAYPKESLIVVIVSNARGGNLQPYAAQIAENILASE
jgi:serine beta-lactamase-like protein LACTB